MGIGRREFMKLVGLALAGVSIDPLKAVALNQNYYVNKKFGLMLEKPNDWDFISHHEFDNLKEVQLLSDDFEPIKVEAWEELTDPILCIAKYGTDKEEYKCKLSPAINIWVNHKSEVEDQGYESFLDLAEDSFIGMQQMFKELEVVQNVTPTLISGCEAFETKTQFLYVNTECNLSIKCEMWSFLVDHGDHYYSFNMIDSQQVNEVETKTFEEFVKTIKLS
jgi:hypothetical protein